MADIVYTHQSAMCVTRISVTVLVRSNFLIPVRKELKLDFSLSHIFNLDHNRGLIYLVECLPFTTVMNLSITKSLFLRL